jgi:type VI secretion system protein ImpL
MLWLWILLGVLTVVAWVGVFFPGYPWWIALIATIVFALVVVTVLVVRRLRANGRAAALEKELLRQAGAHAEHARPDRRAEILQLQAQMKGAIEALKKSKLGMRGGQSALYALPWYVIVGPPASGKTTALEQSGLPFVGASGGAPKVRGTAGTKNCDWWFSKDAILLDTAGRFAINEDDPEEWFAFLDTVKKFRAERPLDGVIVAMSLAELMSASDSQIEELAAKLRARIEEVLTRFEMVLPVYVMFTKADLVAGFVEYWSDLGKQQRGQVWGATFLIDDERLAEPQAAFDGEFDTLTEALHARLIDRLPNERMPEARARTLQFPVEFQSLKPVLGRFIDELCRPNPYQDAPIVRGFYFTSGTQVGRPLDRVLSGMVQGFNLRLNFKGDRAPGPTHSYFVTDLFKTVIFPDRNLAMRSSSRIRRRVRKQIYYMAAALLAMLAVIIPAIFSYLDNSDLVNATGKQVSDVLKLGREKGQGAVTTSLDPLLSRTQELEKAKASFSIPWYWGSYSAGALLEPVHGFYVDRLRTVIEGPVKDQLVADVRSVGDLVRADSQNFMASYNDVRLYVMLLQPEHLVPEWAAEKLAAEWVRAARIDGDLDPAQLQIHARYYVDALAADHTLAWKADDAALSAARGRLLRQPLEELQYQWLLSSIGGVPPIRPEQIFTGGSIAYMTTRGGSVEVPGPYTRAGWQKAKIALDSEDSTLVMEPWVLGEAPSGDNAKGANADRLKNIYFQRYVRAWWDFLGGINVQAPTDVRTAVEEIRVLADAEGPYVRLFRAISDNGKLDMSPPSLVGKALAKGSSLVSGALDKMKGTAGMAVDAGAAKEKKEKTESPVERQLKPLIKFGFGDGTPGAPTGLSQYLSQLSGLEVSLGQLADSRGEPTLQFQDELARTASVVERLLGGFDPATRNLAEPLLMNPIRGSRAGVAGTAYTALGDKWKAEVWDYYNTKIAPRYPFTRTAPDDVAIAEFGEFFKPTAGVLWQFFDKNLTDRIVRAGSAFMTKPSADPIPLTGGFLDCLSKAQDITDAVFGAGAEPSVPFSIKLEPAGAEVSEVTFTVDGQQIVYRNEPERWFPMQWPGKGATRGATLQVKGAGFTDQIPRNGDFGFFRLLEVGNVKAVAATRDAAITLVASYAPTRANQPPTTLSFRPSKSMHPLGQGFFARLKCPSVILGGGTAPPPRLQPGLQ